MAGKNGNNSKIFVQETRKIANIASIVNTLRRPKEAQSGQFSRQYSRRTTRSKNLNYGQSALGLSGVSFLHDAAETGKLAILKNIIEGGEAVDKPDVEMEWTPLMFACAFNHKTVAVYLIAKGADLTLRDKIERTALHIAIGEGHSDMVNLLISKGAELNAQNRYGSTPLVSACLNEFYDIAATLLLAGADFNQRTDDGRTAMEFISSVEQRLQMEGLIAELKLKEVQQSEPTFSTTVEELETKLLPFMELLTAPGCHIDTLLLQHIDIVPYLLISIPDCLVPTVAPVVIYNGSKEKLVALLRELLRVQNRSILQVVVNIRHALCNSAQTHPVEEEELMLEARKIDGALNAILNFPKLDDTTCMEIVLLPNHSATSNHKNHGIEWYDDDNKSRSFNVASLDQEEFLGSCLAGDVRAPYGCAPILSRLLNTFYGTHIKASPLFIFGPLAADPSFFAYTFVLTNSPHLKWQMVSWWNPRSCPAVMFMMEGSSKAIMLLLVAYITVHDYGRNQQLGFNGTPAQISLLFMLYCSLMYEIGQLEDSGDESIVSKLREHFSSTWNKLDAIAYLLILMWAVLLIFPSEGVACQIVLSLSAIPLSLCLLQYLSASKSLGRLVITIFEMVSDLTVFVWVFVMCGLGFTVTLWGLFSQTGPAAFGGNEGAWPTVIQLFAAMMGGINYTLFTGDSAVVNTGIAVYILWTIFMGIMLINLLIARMLGSHDRIEEDSKAHWGFMMGEVTKSYLLREERSPLWMLPAPFNFLTVVFYPVHYYCLHKYHISVSGTFSNMFLRVIGAIPRSFAWIALPWSYLLAGGASRAGAIFNAGVVLLGALAVAFAPVILIINMLLALWPYFEDVITYVQLIEGDDEELDGHLKLSKAKQSIFGALHSWWHGSKYLVLTASDIHRARVAGGDVASGKSYSRIKTSNRKGAAISGKSEGGVNFSAEQQGEDGPEACTAAALGLDASVPTPTGSSGKRRKKKERRATDAADAAAQSPTHAVAAVVEMASNKSEACGQVAIHTTESAVADGPVGAVGAVGALEDSARQRSGSHGSAKGPADESTEIGSGDGGGWKKAEVSKKGIRPLGDATAAATATTTAAFPSEGDSAQVSDVAKVKAKELSSKVGKSVMKFKSLKGKGKSKKSGENASESADGMAAVRPDISLQVDRPYTKVDGNDGQVSDISSSDSDSSDSEGFEEESEALQDCGPEPSTEVVAISQQSGLEAGQGPEQAMAPLQDQDQGQGQGQGQVSRPKPRRQSNYGLNGKGDKEAQLFTNPALPPPASASHAVDFLLPVTAKRMVGSLGGGHGGGLFQTSSGGHAKGDKEAQHFLAKASSPSNKAGSRGANFLRMASTIATSMQGAPSEDDGDGDESVGTGGGRHSNASGAIGRNAKVFPRSPSAKSLQKGTSVNLLHVPTTPKVVAHHHHSAIAATADAANGGPEMGEELTYTELWADKDTATLFDAIIPPVQLSVQLQRQLSEAEEKQGGAMAVMQQKLDTQAVCHIAAMAEMRSQFEAQSAAMLDMQQRLERQAEEQAAQLAEMMTLLKRR